jgi:ABC-2 type transport system permease protein
MIETLLRIGWLNLRRDRVAQALTFLLPIIFFSIFATVFGGQGSDRTSRVSVAVVDEDRSELSQRIIAGLKKEPALRVRTTVSGEDTGDPLDRAIGERLVREGDLPVAIVLPAGMGAEFGRRGSAAECRFSCLPMSPTRLRRRWSRDCCRR